MSLQLLFVTQIFEVLRILSKSGTVWVHSHNRGNMFWGDFFLGVSQWLKNMPSNQEMQVQPISQEDSLEEEIFHSSLENPMDREDGGLQSRVSQRVGHD